MMSNSGATSEWLKSIGVGSEVYATVYSGGTWSRGVARICKITEDTPKRWKIGDTQFNKDDGRGFHGSFIIEVTDDHRKAAHITALLGLYRNFCSEIVSAQQQIVQFPVNDIEIITSKLKAIVKLIKNRKE